METHFPRPLPPLSRDVILSEFPRGVKETFARYGMILETVDLRVVDGFIYVRNRAVGEPEEAGSFTPPPSVMKLMFHLHPALVRRRRVTRTVFEVRPWLEDFRFWNESLKPEMIGTHQALLRVKLGELSDSALFSHLVACLAQLRRAMFHHARLTLTSLLPVGDFLVHAQEWTGLDEARLLRLLNGSSSISANRLPQTLELVEAIRATPSAEELLSQQAPPRDVLDQLMAHPEVGTAAREYLDFVGYRLLGGYDIGSPVGFEHPQLLLVGLRAALEASRQPAKPEESPLVQVRDQVPARHLPLFDTLLAEARKLNRLRDERVLYGDCWSSGVLRRAVLHAGDRLVKRGRLEEPGQLVEADLEEMRALLSGEAGPSAEELAARARLRQRHGHEVPLQYGPGPQKLPPIEWFPRDLRRMIAINFAWHRAFADFQTASSHQVVRGVGVSSGRYTGTARRVDGPEELHRVRPGDVLVTSSTSPAYNVVLPLLGAIVTDWGGALSHAAIITREYGIPGVVGTREGSRLIPEGVQVQVDGDAGEVRVMQ